MDDEENSFQEGLEKESQENKSKNFIFVSIVIIFVVFIVIVFVPKDNNNENKILLNVSEEHSNVARAFEDCLSSTIFSERKGCVHNIGINEEEKSAILLAVEEHCKNLVNKDKNSAEGSLEYCIFTAEILFDEQFNCSLLEYSDNEAFCNALLSNNTEECSKIENPNLRPLCFSELGY
ncbi:MAG: hypothetical protein PWQ87_790 [Candidatus Woesearchaeota archaeon]|nr:hypothetical protein [Candidatus Woesearchaeota archaeon]